MSANKTDPWAHRSQGMRCATCMFFVPKDDTGLGRCRRRAPTMNGFPVVYPSDWCGDHKLDRDPHVRAAEAGKPGDVVMVERR